jgi:hypothetical protein
MAAFPRVGPSHRRVRWPGDLLFVTQTRAPAHQAGRVLGARTIANVTVPAIGGARGPSFWDARSGDTQRRANLGARGADSIVFWHLWMPLGRGVTLESLS